nr:uncharacterized protein LOC107413549 [Ziziphus jujuba var. spinosa]XP_048325319.1 uncharacterized protein LOC107413549 [Ziziphus jujuba var. spinosa]XP_048325321.1 uncharacterized protein LOC107413549 [Ziziphus jujuba var. spinosa]
MIVIQTLPGANAIIPLCQVLCRSIPLPLSRSCGESREAKECLCCVGIGIQVMMLSQSQYDLVHGSEGFTAYSDPTCTLHGAIRPSTTADGEHVKKAVDFALEQYSQREGADIVSLKRIVKVNLEFHGRTIVVYYITLDLETNFSGGDDEQESEPAAFYYEAKVYRYIPDDLFALDIFRPAFYYHAPY